MLTVVDKILAVKYKEMVGFYNIINTSNNTTLLGDVTLLSSLTTSSISILHQTASVNSNLLISGTSYLSNDTIFNSLETWFVA